jgi:hypothetical protein
MGERNPPIVIYADILVSSFLAAVLVKYTLSTLHVYTFAQQECNLRY